MDDLKSFELGRICERLAKSRGVVLKRVGFSSVASGLATKGAYDLSSDKRAAISSTGLESLSGSTITFAFAGVLYDGSIGDKALSEILLAEDAQRQILVQAGIPNRIDSIKVVDAREREALKGLLRASAHPQGEYLDAEVKRKISNLTGVEAYLDALIGRQVIAAE